MIGPVASPGPRRVTARGARTRERIVTTAADLMYNQGVGATTLDDVVTAGGVSKSQLYQHFSGKEMLVRAVVELTGERILDRERTALEHVATFAGLRRWRDSLVRLNGVRHGALGCPLGSLAHGISDRDEVARAAISRFFREWERLLSDALHRMQTNGLLPPDASTPQLATGLIGALQGGYTLAQTAHDTTPMATSIDMALARLESMSTT